MTRTRKHMKLPNGFGQISKLKANLRKPYRAMITVGISPEGRPICKILKPQGYFETYNDAYYALMEHHKNPYDVSKDATFSELFNEWIKLKADTVSEGRLRLFKSTFNNLSDLHNVPMHDIKPRVIREQMDKYKYLVRGPKDVKTVLNLVFDYAIENEVVEKNYAREIRANTKIEEGSHHISFTDEEISTLWKHSDEDSVQMILIQCYTGMRPGELVNLKPENISLDENKIVGGSKTEAGRNRQIPIHPCIKEFLKHFLKISSGKNFGFLFKDSSSEKVRIESYRKDFKKVMEKYQLNPEHKCHDPRKYFVTTAKKYQLDEYAIKLIVGHAIRDITEKVYTERSFDWLYEQICMINVQTGQV